MEKMSLKEAISHLSWLNFDEDGELAPPITWYYKIGKKRNEALKTLIDFAKEHIKEEKNESRS